MTQAEQEALIQGPIEDVRHGKCLIVCPTVESNRSGRFPSQAVVVTTAARRMIELSKGGEKVAAIVVRGEEFDPALNPDFRAISENLRDLRDKWFPRAKMVLESNPKFLADPNARHALVCYDRPLLQLWAGTQKGYGAVTGQAGADLKLAIAHLEVIEHEQLVIDMRLTRGDADNSSDSEVRAWIKHLEAVKPSAVEIWTPPKALTAGGKKVAPVTATKLKSVAEATAEKTGIPVEVVAQAG